MEKSTGFNLGYLIFALLAVLLLRDMWTQARAIETLPYSRFEQYLKDGKIEEISVGDTVITGKLKSPEGGKTFVAATLVEPAMAERLSRFDVKYTRVHQSTWVHDIVAWLGPALLLFAIWYFAFRRFADKMGAGGFRTASARSATPCSGPPKSVT